ncbi:MAG: hypothetical protein QOJ79_2094, partial [Actinomycetota bacterium]|nr:hypothetical protein [Actinomycetota bacterium]
RMQTWAEADMPAADAVISLAPAPAEPVLQAVPTQPEPVLQAVAEQPVVPSYTPPVAPDGGWSTYAPTGSVLPSENPHWS